MLSQPSIAALRHRSYKRTFYLFAILFAAASIYHALPLLRSSFPIRGPHWRHGLFVLIDAIFCGLVLARPRWLAIPLTVLTVYSLWSHGTGAWKLWDMEKQIDWLS